MENCNFKANDTVYWGYLKGVVIEADKNERYPLTVLFENRDTETSFTEDGRFMEWQPPVLSLRPYVLKGFNQESIKELPEVGSICLFSNNKEHFDKNVGHVATLNHIIAFDLFIDGAANEWKYCKQVELNVIKK
jgi:hypothetical protein